MWHRVRQQVPKQTTKWGIAALGLFAVLVFVPGRTYAALTPLTVENPKSSSYGLEATKKQPPPTDAPTITSPGNGNNYSESTATVGGLCKTGLIVQVYDNGALVGAVDCKNGSFSIQITLFPGQNDITAFLFDDLGQSGPISNSITVYFNNVNLTAFGTLITLTSNYGRRASNPGTALKWPLILSGGNGPYAFSIDWGDGTKADLKSVASPGNVEISHTYSQAGLYHVTVKVTDVNGVSAFLQLLAVANGTPPASSAGATTKTVTVVKWIWIPAVATLVLLFPAFWLGRRSELVSLHKKLEKDMANFKEL